MANRRKKKKNRILTAAAWLTMAALLLIGLYELLFVPAGTGFSAQENLPPQAAFMMAVSLAVSGSLSA